MKIRAFLIAVAIFLNLPATAQYVTVVRAYEVGLDRFNVPVTNSGVIFFSQCEGCESVSGRLTADTRFIINGKAIDLKQFRTRVFQVRDKAHETVSVRHHLESNTIESISVTL